MAYITQHITKRKRKIAEIIEDAYNGRFERELNMARDTPAQYAQMNLKENNNIKQMVVAGSRRLFINIS